MQKIVYCLLVSFCLLPCKSIADETLYVSAKSATMRDNPAKENAKPVSVKQGEAVQKSEFKKDWFKVAYGKNKGWIYKGKVSKTKPKADPSLKDASGNRNELAGENVAASSAVRGLGPLSTKFAGKNPVTDEHRRYTYYHQSYVALENVKKESQEGKEEKDSKLAQYKIVPVELTPGDIQNFLKEGKLGEYADAPNVD